MSIVAKKYVKALLNSLNDDELSTLYNSLRSIVPAFKNKKFIAILQSTELAKSEKESFILSTIEMKDKKTENFIKLLTQNDRLGDIPSIVNELSNQIAKKNNSYQGVIISGQEVGADKIGEIETLLSQKFDAKIALTNKVTGYAGLKVEIESLGVEIGLSTDRLKSQIAENILNAI